MDLRNMTVSGSCGMRMLHDPYMEKDSYYNNRNCDGNNFFGSSIQRNTEYIVERIKNSRQRYIFAMKGSNMYRLSVGYEKVNNPNHQMNSRCSNYVIISDEMITEFELLPILSDQISPGIWKYFMLGNKFDRSKPVQTIPINDIVGYYIFAYMGETEQCITDLDGSNFYFYAFKNSVFDIGQDAFDHKRREIVVRQEKEEENRRIIERNDQIRRDKLMAENPDIVCPVCLNDLISNSKFICSHQLCMTCSNRVSKCPICRSEICVSHKK